MRVTIFDYGAGNLHSLAKAIERGGVDVRVETDPVRAVEVRVQGMDGSGRELRVSPTTSTPIE